MRATVEFLETSTSVPTSITQTFTSTQSKGCSLKSANTAVPADASVTLNCLRPPSSISLNMQVSANGPLRVFVTDILDGQRIRFRQSGARCLSPTPPGPLVSLDKSCPPFGQADGSLVSVSVAIPSSSTGLTVTILNTGPGTIMISQLSIFEDTESAAHPLGVPLGQTPIDQQQLSSTFPNNSVFSAAFL
jgi:hypothetical protein